MNILSLFDGISCGQVALQQAEIRVDKYFASEIDYYAKDIASRNFPHTKQLGDVKYISLQSLPKIGLLIGGSPCQGFSFAGKQLNFDDPRSKLFFEYVRVLEEVKPDYFLLENVNMKKEYRDIISKHLGCEPTLINSDLFVPQNRPRLYWTNIPIRPLPVRPNWDFKYYQWRRTYFRENKSGVCPCLTANMGTGGHNVPLKSMNRDDKLSVHECEKLQGLVENYTLGASKSQRYKMLGNGWTVPVITHIFKGLHDVL